MCGIVGYIGPKQAAPLILEALKKLEYRGYDSSGIAIADGNKLSVVKAKGRLSVLEEMTDGGRALPGCLGIGHTRWATHGEPNDVNAHPHLSQHGDVALVHNGIVENYIELRDFLTEQGYSFMSETDTEIAANLVEHLYRSNREDGPEAAIREALSLISGAFALGIIFADHPDTLYAVRKDSPLIVGVGKGENFIASDVPAILKHTREVVYLNDGELVEFTAQDAHFYSADGRLLEKKPEHITWEMSAAEKGGYPHFMIKEIHEQPKALRATIGPRVQNGRVTLDGISLTEDYLRGLKRIYIAACGYRKNRARHLHLHGLIGLQDQHLCLVSVLQGSPIGLRAVCVQQFSGQLIALGLRFRKSSGEQRIFCIILVILASVKDQLQGRSPVLYFKLLHGDVIRRKVLIILCKLRFNLLLKLFGIVKILVKALHNRVGYLPLFINGQGTLLRDRPTAGQGRYHTRQEHKTD